MSLIGWVSPHRDSRWNRVLQQGQRLELRLLERCQKLFELRIQNQHLFLDIPASNEEMAEIVHGKEKIEAGKEALKQILPKKETPATRTELYNWGGVEMVATMPDCRTMLFQTNECYYIDRLYFSRINLEELSLIDTLTTDSLEVVKRRGKYNLPPSAHGKDPSIVLLFERIVARKENEVELRLKQINPCSRETEEDRKDYDRWNRELRAFGHIPYDHPKSSEVLKQIPIQTLEELRRELDKDLALRKENPEALLTHFTYNWPYEKRLIKALAITGIAATSLAAGVYCFYIYAPLGIAFSYTAKL